MVKDHPSLAYHGHLLQRKGEKKIDLVAQRLGRITRVVSSHERERGRRFNPLKVSASLPLWPHSGWTENTF
jgi:hypothetical protein